MIIFGFIRLLEFSSSVRVTFWSMECCSWEPCISRLSHKIQLHVTPRAQFERFVFLSQVRNVFAWRREQPAKVWKRFWRFCKVRIVLVQEYARRSRHDWSWTSVEIESIASRVLQLRITDMVQHSLHRKAVLVESPRPFRCAGFFAAPWVIRWHFWHFRLAGAMARMVWCHGPSFDCMCGKIFLLGLPLKALWLHLHVQVAFVEGNSWCGHVVRWEVIVLAAWLSRHTGWHRCGMTMRFPPRSSWDPPNQYSTSIKTYQMFQDMSRHLSQKHHDHHNPTGTGARRTSPHTHISSIWMYLIHLRTFACTVVYRWVLKKFTFCFSEVGNAKDSERRDGMMEKCLFAG